MIKRVAIGFGILVLSLVLALVVYYKIEPVGYYYRWGSGVSDIPEGFECDKPFDLGGCDVYTCKSKEGYVKRAKLMFYKGRLVDVFVRYENAKNFRMDPKARRSMFCYLDYKDVKMGDKYLGEGYLNQDYYVCMKGDVLYEYLTYVDGQLYFNPRTKESRYETYYEQCHDTALGRPWL